MTTFALPAEPSSPVWLVDHPDHGGPLRFDPPTVARTWYNSAHDIELPWVELLALGDVDDEYPGEPNLHGTCTPWHRDGIIVRDAARGKVFYVQGAHTTSEEDRALAALVVELVNAHAARDTAAADQVDGPADRLALAVNDVVLRWQRATLSTRAKVNDVCPELGELLKAQCNAHAAVNR